MTINILWLLVCSCLILFMQAGFTCYEAGSIQTKNIIAISIENLATLMISAILFFAAGYAIMFKNTSFLFTGIEDSYELSYALLQLMLAAVCVTIFGGAMSERTKLSALFVAAAVAAIIIYPVFGRWVWSEGGWLRNLGYMDFAGASVVHLTGGLLALAGVLAVGKRNDPDTGKSNIPFAVLGVFILWFGWFGFNGGACGAGTERLPLVLINTTIGPAFGTAGALTYHIIFKRRHNYLIAIFDGILGSLAAITACSFYVQPWGAAAIAYIAGFMTVTVHYTIKRFDIDDAVDAIPVHIAGGLSGLLLMPFFMEAEYLQATTRLHQFGIQVLGVCVDIIWVLAVAFLLFKLIDKTIGIRVSIEAEEKGLNISEFEDIYSWEKHQEISGYQEKLQEKNKLLRKQSRLLAVTEEQEKDKIRKELHDGVGQSLAALKVTLGIAKKKEDNEKLIDHAISMTDSTIKEMRAILNSLNPPKLEEGPENALRVLAAEISGIEGVTCDVHVDRHFPNFGETISLNIYRIVQEACSNALKHGHATHIDINVIHNETDCIIEIIDNGEGFHVSKQEFGMGIPSMGDRMRMLGGDFSIHSTVGVGTKVVAEVPFNGK